MTAIHHFQDPPGDLFEEHYENGHLSIYENKTPGKLHAVLVPEKPLRKKYREFGRNLDPIFFEVTTKNFSESEENSWENLQNFTPKILYRNKDKTWWIREPRLYFTEISSFPSDQELLCESTKIKMVIDVRNTKKTIGYYTKKTLLYPVCIVVDAVTWPIQLYIIPAVVYGSGF
ncbi:hypothetical protein P3T73_03465 [Kiritimatiellota bacterium B12222]|nr:hypothetical protein P3T73_03465 [Kiritimatiellota bacterium B12222]